MNGWREGRIAGGQHLDGNLMRDLEPEALSYSVQRFLTQRNCDIMNVCYFNILNLGSVDNNGTIL